LFKVFEIPGTGESLNLIFLSSKYPGAQRFFDLEDFQIPGSGGSWIVISKYVEPTGILKI